ncbi:hypothetical protein ACFPRL_18110 [Pseudoclavibacter helvolus]
MPPTIIAIATKKNAQKPRMIQVSARTAPIRMPVRVRDAVFTGLALLPSCRCCRLRRGGARR